MAFSINISDFSSPIRGFFSSEAEKAHAYLKKTDSCQRLQALFSSSHPQQPVGVPEESLDPIALFDEACAPSNNDFSMADSSYLKEISFLRELVGEGKEVDLNAFRACFGLQDHEKNLLPFLAFHREKFDPIQFQVLEAAIQRQLHLSQLGRKKPNSLKLKASANAFVKEVYDLKVGESACLMAKIPSSHSFVEYTEKAQKHFLGGRTFGEIVSSVTEELQQATGFFEGAAEQQQALRRIIGEGLPSFFSERLVDAVVEDVHELFLENGKGSIGGEEIAESIWSRLTEEGIEGVLQEAVQGSFDFVTGAIKDQTEGLERSVMSLLPDTLEEILRGSGLFEQELWSWIKLEKISETEIKLKVFNTGKDLDAFVIPSVAIEKLDVEFIYRLLSYQVWPKWAWAKGYTSDDFRALFEMLNTPIEKVDFKRTLGPCDLLNRWLEAEYPESFSPLECFEERKDLLTALWQKEPKEWSLLISAADTLKSEAKQLHDEGIITEQQLREVLATVWEVKEHHKESMQEEKVQHQRSMVIPPIVVQQLEKLEISEANMEMFRQALVDLFGNDATEMVDAALQELCLSKGLRRGNSHTISFSKHFGFDKVKALLAQVKAMRGSPLHVYRLLARTLDILFHPILSKVLALTFHALCSALIPGYVFINPFGISVVIASLFPLGLEGMKRLFPAKVHETLSAVYDLLGDSVQYLKYRIELFLIRALVRILFSSERMETAQNWLRAGQQQITRDGELRYTISGSVRQESPSIVEEESDEEMSCMCGPTPEEELSPRENTTYVFEGVVSTGGERVLEEEEVHFDFNQELEPTPSYPELPIQPESIHETLACWVEQIHLHQELVADNVISERAALNHLHRELRKLPIPNSEEMGFWDRVEDPLRAMEYLYQIASCVASSTFDQKNHYEHVESTVSLYALYAIIDHLARQIPESYLEGFEANGVHLLMWLNGHIPTVESPDTYVQLKATAHYFGIDLMKRYTRWEIRDYSKERLFDEFDVYLGKELFSDREKARPKYTGTEGDGFWLHRGIGNEKEGRFYQQFLDDPFMRERLVLLGFSNRAALKDSRNHLKCYSAIVCDAPVNETLQGLDLSSEEESRLWGELVKNDHPLDQRHGLLPRSIHHLRTLHFLSKDMLLDAAIVDKDSLEQEPFYRKAELKKRETNWLEKKFLETFPIFNTPGMQLLMRRKPSKVFKQKGYTGGVYRINCSGSDDFERWKKQVTDIQGIAAPKLTKQDPWEVMLEDADSQSTRNLKLLDFENHDAFMRVLGIFKRSLDSLCDFSKMKLLISIVMRAGFLQTQIAECPETIPAIVDFFDKALASVAYTSFNETEIELCRLGLYVVRYCEEVDPSATQLFPDFRQMLREQRANAAKEEDRQRARSFLLESYLATSEEAISEEMRDDLLEAFEAKEEVSSTAQLMLAKWGYAAKQKEKVSNDEEPSAPPIEQSYIEVSLGRVSHGLSLLSWFEDLSNIFVRCERSDPEKVTEIQMPRLGLLFEVKGAEEGQRAYIKGDALGGYYLSPKQKRDELSDYVRYLVLENEKSEKRVLLRVGQYASLGGALIDQVSDGKFLSPLLRRYIEQYGEEEKVMTYALNEQGQLVSTEPVAMAQLLAYHAYAGNWEEVRRCYRELELMGRMEPFDGEVEALLDLAVIPLTLVGDQQKRHLILKLAALRQENRLLHQSGREKYALEGIGESERDLLYWVVIQYHYHLYLKDLDEGAPQELSEFDELFLCDHIQKGSKNLLKRVTEWKSSVIAPITDVAMLPKVAARCNALRSIHKSELSLKDRAKFLIIQEFLAESGEKTSGNKKEGEVSLIGKSIGLIAKNMREQVGKPEVELIERVLQKVESLVDLEEKLEPPTTLSAMKPGDLFCFFPKYLSYALGICEEEVREEFFRTLKFLQGKLSPEETMIIELLQGVANAPFGSEEHRMGIDLQELLSVQLSPEMEAEEKEVLIEEILMTKRTISIDQYTEMLLVNVIQELFPHISKASLEEMIAEVKREDVSRYENADRTPPVKASKMYSMAIPQYFVDYFAMVLEPNAKKTIRNQLLMVKERKLSSVNNGLLTLLQAICDAPKEQREKIEALQELLILHVRNPQKKTAQEKLERVREIAKKYEIPSAHNLNTFAKEWLQKLRTKTALQEVFSGRNVRALKGIGGQLVERVGRNFLMKQAKNLFFSFTGIKPLISVLSYGTSLFRGVNNLQELSGKRDAIQEIPRIQDHEVSLTALREREEKIDRFLEELRENYFIKNERVESEEEEVAPLLIDEEDPESVKSAFTQLNQSLEDYYRREREIHTTYVMKEEQNEEAFREALAGVKNHAELFLENDKKAIMRFVNDPRPLNLREASIEQFEADVYRLSSSQTHLSFEQLLEYFCRNEDGAILERTFLSPEELLDLKERLMLHIVTQSRFNLLFERMEKGADVEVIARELDRKRVYRFEEGGDVHLYKAKLLFEYFTKKMMWKRPMEQIDKMLKSPHEKLVLELIPGSGKTSCGIPIQDFYAEGLVCNVFPAPMAQTNAPTVSRQVKDLFGKSATTLKFFRGMKWTRRKLEGIYQTFRRTFFERGLLNITKENAQTLELSFLEIALKALEEGLTSSVEDKLTIFKNTLSLLRKEGKAIIDEPHEVFARKTMLNHPMGQEKRLKKKYLKVMEEVIFTLATHPEVQKTLSFKSKKWTPIEKEQFFADVQPLLAESLSQHTMFASFTDEEREAFKRYISGESHEIPRFVRLGKEKEEMALIKGMLTAILPHCLETIIDVDYCPSKLGEDEYARPSKGNNNPIETAQIRNPFEAYTKTCLMLLHHRLNNGQAEKLLDFLYEKASEEVSATGKLLQKTKAARFFKAQTGSELHLFKENPKYREQKEKEVMKALRGKERAILGYARHLIAKEMTYYTYNLSSNPQNFESMFNSFYSGTGTPYNHGSYPHGTEVIWDKGTIGESLDVLIKKCSGDDGVQVLENENPKRVLEEILETYFVSGSDYTAVIDRGALFRGLSHQKVAEAMLCYVKANRPDIEGVVFYNHENALMILERDASKPKPLEESSVPPGKRFTYYDQSHTYGADVTQKKYARGVLTVGEDLTIEGLTQAQWRMRGLKTLEQSVTLVMPHSVKAKISDGEQCTVEDVIAFAQTNETLKLAEDLYFADRHKVANVVRRAVLDKMFEADSIKQMLKILQEFIAVFYVEVADNPFELYGKVDDYKSPEEVLLQYKKQMFAVIKDSHVFSSKEKTKIQEQLKVIHTEGYPEKVHVYVDAQGNFSVSKDYLGEEATVEQTAHTNQEEHAHEEEQQHEEMDVQEELNNEIELLKGKNLHAERKEWPEELEPTNLRWMEEGPVSLIPLKEGFSGVSNALLRRLAKWGDGDIYVTENFIPASFSSSRYLWKETVSLDLFGPKQIPIFEVLVIEQKGAYKVIVLEQSEMQYWREMLKKEKRKKTVFNPHVKLALYDIESDGLAATGKGGMDPFALSENLEFQLKIAKLKFLNGMVFYSEVQKEALLPALQKMGVKKALKSFRYIHRHHEVAKFEGSDLEEVFQKAFGQKPEDEALIFS